VTDFSKDPGVVMGYPYCAENVEWVTERLEDSEGYRTTLKLFSTDTYAPLWTIKVDTSLLPDNSTWLQ